MSTLQRRLITLAIVGVSFLAVNLSGCVPKTLPTSEKGRSGMPTGVYDRGVPPPRWDMDLKVLPLYPGAKQFGSKYGFISPDPMVTVVSYYKEEMPDAEVVESTSPLLITTFKRELYILEIKIGEGGANTLITFSKPPE